MLRTLLPSGLRNDIDENDRRARSFEAIFQGMGLKSATQSYSYALSSTKVRPLSVSRSFTHSSPCAEDEWNERLRDPESTQDGRCGGSCVECVVAESSEGRGGREEGEYSRCSHRAGACQLPAE